MIEELISSQSSLSVNQLLPTQIIKLCRFSKCLIFDYVIEKRWWKHWLNFFFSHDVHFFIHFVNKQPESGLSLKSWLNFLRLLRSKLLNPINHGGGPYGPPAWKSAVFGRKNEIFQKWMDGKSPPQAPQPHLYPTILLYLLEPLLNHLWNV